MLPPGRQIELRCDWVSHGFSCLPVSLRKNICRLDSDLVVKQMRIHCVGPILCLWSIGARTATAIGVVMWGMGKPFGTFFRVVICLV